MRRAALVFLLVALPALILAGDDALESNLRDYARPLADSGFLSGCLAVSRDGRRIARACYGFADAERKRPINADTRLCIASLSKPVTTVAILRLVDLGKLRLDDPVSRWIADFPQGDSITVTDLLTHRAGIAHRVTDPDEESRRFTPTDIVRRIRERGLEFEPHAARHYSSAGYTVLAAIIERATGKSFGDAMQELVFVPLGMRDTFHPDGRPIAHRATSFVAGPDGPMEAPRKDYGFLAGAGSLFSTTDDVLRFAQACVDHALLSEDAWKAFHDLGWARDDVVRWSGSTNGFGSWLDIDKKERVVSVFLGNAGTGAANVLRNALPLLVAGKAPPAPPSAPKRVKLTAEQMSGLAGGYSREPGPPSLIVTLEHGVLRIGDDVVYPVAVDRFFNPAYYSEVQFERDDAGLARAIRIQAVGLPAPLVFQRVP